MKNLVFIGLMALVTICSRANAQEAPVIINPETGAVVNFTRAYWDANVDIANRRIQCDYFSFNAETAVFVKGEDRIGAPISNSSAIRTFNTQYSHPPLPNEITPPVNIGLVVLSDGRNLDRHNSPPFWTVIDGRYHGPASISEYVEIVAFNASTENAVRSWFQDGSVPAYNVCYDLDGAPLIPTGIVASGNTQLVDLPDFTFDFPEVPESIPEIINQETGDTVQFVRGRWSYNKDIAGNTLFCDVWDFRNQISYERQPDTGTYFVYYPYSGGEVIQRSTKAAIDQSFFFIGDEDISSTRLLPRGFNDSYMEITDDGYRMWIGSSSFYNCTVEKPFALFTQQVESLPFGPTEFLPLVADEISPVLADNTAPLVVTENCDYTDADDFDGYGFDPVTMLSCPPLADDNSVDETTDAANNAQDTDNTDSANVAQINPAPVDNASDDSTVNSGDSTAVQNTNDVQTNTDTTDNSSSDSTGNLNDASTENTAVEEEAVASNTQTDSTGADLGSSDETVSPSSGGGSFWLPILMFAVAFRRPLRARQK